MVKKMSWHDISAVKLSMLAFTLLLAKLWPPILSLDWYWYAALFVLALIKPAYSMFK
jgi:hypothetical protein